MKKARKLSTKALRNSKAAHAAFGFRSHSGWAVLIVVAGAPRSPVVIDRRRIELVDPGIPGSKQPYHAAQKLDLKEAEKLIKRSSDGAKLRAREAVRAVIADLHEKGHDVVGGGIGLASGQPVPALAETLASHARIHTAEGELFRSALIHASEQCNLPIARVRERELFARGAAQLHIPAGGLQRRLAEMGRSIGPPWRQDEKHATLVAWLALKAASRR
jgi:hypothetical protein